VLLGQVSGLAVQGQSFGMKAVQAMSSSLLPFLAAAGSSTGEPPVWIQFLPLVAMVVIFWFLILRPQMRRQKEHQAKIGGIKKGDQVLTGGGLVGKVLKVDEHYAELELGQNIKVKALKSTIADVIPPGGTAAND
jgi:preprotein translocase subunit YajC